MRHFGIPEEKKSRVIINTDAKNEVDDQFAIVQAALSESMDVKAFIAAHFGTEKSPTSMLDNYEEIMHVLKLIGRENEFNVLHGGELGKYLVENVIAFNNAGIERPKEHRGLGDSPAISIILFNDCGE